MVKSQSAMEYLMTYGWAILIIAVVLGALYSLGLFNGSTLAPKAQPGACQVYRPNGPLTVQYISLAGACTNELPEYVAQFNGASSLVSTSASGFPTGSAARSAFAWINLNAWTSGACLPVFSYGTQSALKWSTLRVCNIGSPFPDFSGYSDDEVGGMVFAVGSWEFIGYTYAQGASTVTIYLNGQSNTIGLTTLNTILPASLPSVIGEDSNFNVAGQAWPGYIANVQIYNSSLDANSVQALYQEGIGGAPINLQSLIGWWPLNGNANDYSGNLNNGVSTNVIYANQWLSGYTVP